MTDLTAKQIRGKLNHMKGDGRRFGIQLLGCMRQLKDRETDLDFEYNLRVKLEKKMEDK